MLTSIPPCSVCLRICFCPSFRRCLACFVLSSFLRGSPPSAVEMGGDGSLFSLVEARRSVADERGGTFHRKGTLTCLDPRPTPPACSLFGNSDIIDVVPLTIFGSRGGLGGPVLSLPAVLAITVWLWCLRIPSGIWEKAVSTDRGVVWWW